MNFALLFFLMLKQFIKRVLRFLVHFVLEKSAIMRTINSNQVVKIPKGVSAKVDARIVTIRGPRGKLTRDFRHLAMDLRMLNRKKIMVEKWFGSKKEIAAVRTVCSHIENMIKGGAAQYTMLPK